MMKFTLLLILFIPMIHADEIVGYAYSQALSNDSLQQSHLLYTEKHYYEDNKHTVIYENNNDGIFAEKILQYDIGSHTPNISFSNRYCSERYQIFHKNTDNTVINEATIDIEYSNQCDDKTTNKTLTIEKPYVIDAGFDYFIQDNLALIANQKQVFSYPLPSRVSDVKLMAMHQECEVLEGQFSSLIKNIPFAIDTQDSWQYCVKVRPQSWFLSKLFPAIFLAYSADKKLKMFSGKSNIGNAKGEYKKVFITYQAL